MEEKNAFELLANWRREAKRAELSQTEIDRVFALATSGDYQHLVATLKANKL